MFCCSYASAVDDVALKKQRRFLHRVLCLAWGLTVEFLVLCYVYKCSITRPVSVPEQSARRCLLLLPSCCQHFFLHCVSMADRLKLAMIYNSELQTFCVDLTFIWIYWYLISLDILIARKLHKNSVYVLQLTNPRYYMEMNIVNIYVRICNNFISTLS